MPEYVDKTLCDDRYETVKDTNEKVTNMAVDIGIMKTAFEGHTKNHERRWAHGATIGVLVIALAALIVSIVVAVSK